MSSSDDIRQRISEAYSGDRAQQACHQYDNAMHSMDMDKTDHDQSHDIAREKNSYTLFIIEPEIPLYSVNLSPGKNTIGRAPECEIQLKNPNVSRTHAIINVHENGEITIRDLGSLNGTYLDDHGKLEPDQKYLLHLNSHMKVANTILVLLHN